LKEIPLSKGQVALVDDADFEWLSLFSWHARLNKTTNSYYAFTHIRVPGGKFKKTGMHHVIMFPPWGMVIDHKDHNTLNNQRSNLRLATRSQNNQNHRIRSNNTSGYNGVHFDKSTRKYISIVKSKGKAYYLGLFTDKVEAAKAYDKKAKELFGEFACLNFPLPHAQ